VLKDTIKNVENIGGTKWADILTGDTANNTFKGLAGADIIDGGAGIDTVDYMESTSAVTVDLTNSNNNAGGDALGDVLSNVENIIGSNFNDILTGGAGVNTMNGNLGNDTITGDADADTLDGGDGDDIFNLADGDFVAGENIIGGNGNDTLSLISGTNHDLTLGSISGIEVLNVGAVTTVGLKGSNLVGGSSFSTIIDSGVANNEIDVAISANNSGSNITVDLSSIDVTALVDAGDKFDIDVAAGGNAGYDIIGTNIADEITGGTGNDEITGGLGNDTLDGGVGNDIYIFANSGATNGLDTIAFDPSGDILDFANYLSAGTINQNSGGGSSINAFTAGAGDINSPL
jgi:Ca2+-binding RTX toxin-like protein